MYSLNKEIYFRNIILSGTKENNKKVLNIIPGWKFKTINIQGVIQNCIENEKLNVRVLFDLDIKQSTNVVPIKSSIGDIYNKYEDGYDLSKNQKSNIKDDILYLLCLQINKIIKEYNENNDDIENTIDVLCGIVPSVYDCEQQ